MSFPPYTDSQERSFQSNPTSGARGTRSQQTSWNSSHQRQPSRRGLTPISTTTSRSERPLSGIESPSRAAFSPTRSDFNYAAYPATRHISSRQSSTSSTHSFTSPTGSGQHHVSGLRSRTLTSGSSPRLASSVASLSSASQGLGSSGVGASRLARHSPSLSLSTTGSPASSTGPHSAGGSSTQLTSLVVTQLNILLSTTKEDGDRTKWHNQAEKIRRLVDENGMEVFAQYFRRLLQSNASAIFPGAPRSAGDNAGNYQLLASEMQKILQDPQQAEKIAISLDNTEGDLFRSFDLRTFVEHFQLGPVAKVALALPCRRTSKQDLCSKGMVMFNRNRRQY